MFTNYRLPTLAVLLFVIVCSCLTIFAAAQVQNKLSKIVNPCVNKRTCHECIQTESCAWCMADDIGDKPRCFPSSSKTACDEQYTYNPHTIDEITANYGNMHERHLAGGAAAASGGQMSSGGSYYANSSYSSGSSSSSYGGAYGASRSASASGSSGRFGASEEIVQIWPQRVSLKLRINQVHSLKMFYSQAQDYPLDLYYLMDLSKSMDDDRKKLSQLGDLLSETMRNLTSNFRLGFGSFVDKVLMPYVSTIPKKLEHPCDGCEAPYGYRNHMPLSTDTHIFTSKVKVANVSGNLDAPEGGFDAIMQAIVCRDQVGWRDQARRLLVFSTDAGFHYAGDGKLGGVIEPNDGECHLNSGGEYSYSSIQDYPSISQINYKVKQNSINVIFAVTANQLGVYDKLSQHIEGSSSAQLSVDSSNVVSLVREQYSKISSSIDMKDNATSHVKISYYSSCLGNGPEKPTSRCDNLKFNDVVNFTVQILVTSCPTDPKDWNQVIQIYPVGINESMIIDLEMLCSCDCEHPNHPFYKKESTMCSGHGIHMCGICSCDDTHFGNKCECSATDDHSGIESDVGCRADNTTQVDCSGRGTCLCGVCECEKRPNPDEIISGRYCECDNFSCERHKQLICSGADHGSCECGVCQCKPGWMGSACDCRASNDTCMPPNGGEICSGHGDCECGMCKCKSTEEGRYSGKFCEKCPTCSGRCLELKDCVQCQMYKTGPLKNDEDCAKNCTTFVPIAVEKVLVNETKDEYLCMFYDEDDCKFTFKYNETIDEKIIVHAQQERECPPKVFMLGIVLGVIAAIVLVGLAILLLWKLLTTIHDRREFARFEKERMNAKWDTGENPIYKQATSTFKNPMYAGK